MTRIPNRRATAPSGVNDNNDSHRVNSSDQPKSGPTTRRTRMASTTDANV